MYLDFIWKEEKNYLQCLYEGSEGRRVTLNIHMKEKLEKMNYLGCLYEGSGRRWRRKRREKNKIEEEG